MILILLFLLILILAKRKKEKKPDLVRMVILLRKSGLSNEDIKKKLVDAGWPEKMVEEAIKK